MIGAEAEAGSEALARAEAWRWRHIRRGHSQPLAAALPVALAQLTDSRRLQQPWDIQRLCTHSRLGLAGGGGGGNLAARNFCGCANIFFTRAGQRKCTNTNTNTDAGKLPLRRSIQNAFWGGCRRLCNYWCNFMRKQTSCWLDRGQGLGHRALPTYPQLSNPVGKCNFS